MIGAKKEAIDKAEDRDLFREAMLKIGLDMPKAAVAHNLEDAHKNSRRSWLSNRYSPLIYHGW
jgi:carbamoyl-phosphate synthase large subunit